MAEPEHNQLDDLFRKSGSDSLDDFEREALEGFNSLESRQEAHELQERVDARARELFEKKEKSRPVVYWYAAAGLFLVIGLSVYFVLNKSDLTNKKNVAALEESKPALNAPAEIKPLGNNESQQDQSKDKDQSETKNRPVTVSNDLRQSDKEITTNAGTLSSEKSAAGGKSEKDQSNLFKKAEEKEPAAKALEQKSEPAHVDNLALTIPETEKQKEESPKQLQDQNQKAPVTNSERTQEQVAKKNADVFFTDKKALDDYEGNKDEAVNAQKVQPSNVAVENKAKEKQDIDKMKGKNEPSPSRADDNNNVASNNNRSNNDRHRKEKKSQAAPGRAENGDIALKETGNNKAYNDEDTKSSGKKDDAKLGAGAISYSWSGSYANTNGASVVTREADGYYEGGEKALDKDLREKLKQSEVNKKFDATLFINDKKQVEKVSFTNGDLSKEQKEKVEAALKSLSKFTVKQDKLKKGLFEYKLSYKP
jgi:hypothetical protein